MLHRIAGCVEYHNAEVAKEIGHIEKNCRFKNFCEEKQDEGNLFYACQSATHEKRKGGKEFFAR